MKTNQSKPSRTSMFDVRCSMFGFHVALLLTLSLRAGNEAPPQLGPLSAVVLAGQTSAGFADGPGPTAQFGSITALDLGPQGWLYVADAGNHRIRLVDWVGVVTTLAGTGEDAQRDGPGPEAAFHDLRALSVDGLGNCYVLDGDQLRRVGADGLVITLETIAIPSGYQPPEVTPLLVSGWADTNYVIRGLVVSPQGQVYLAGTAAVSSDRCDSGVCHVQTFGQTNSTRIFCGVGAGRETVAEARRTDGRVWGMASGASWGSGSVLGALARGIGEELLVYRVWHQYWSPPDPFSPESWAYEVVVLGRTPEMSLTATNVSPAGMVALTPDSVLMQGEGKFYVLRTGAAPASVPANRAPQTGLAMDRHGLLYSATTNQVLRFIPTNTVVLWLRPQDPATGEALLSIVSAPGRQVRLEQSRDFQQWDPWQTITSTGQDALALKPESDRLFLRAVLLP